MLEEGHHELRTAKAARFAAWTEAQRVKKAQAEAAAAAALAAAEARAAAKARADMAAVFVPATTTAVSAKGPEAAATAAGSAASFLTPSQWAKGSLSSAMPHTSATGGPLHATAK